MRLVAKPGDPGHQFVALADEQVEDSRLVGGPERRESRPTWRTICATAIALRMLHSRWEAPASDGSLPGRLPSSARAIAS